LQEVTKNRTVIRQTAEIRCFNIYLSFSNFKKIFSVIIDKDKAF
jgi:hypothetical protein